jgi:putative DNA primase/helicase
MTNAPRSSSMTRSQPAKTNGNGHAHVGSIERPAYTWKHLPHELRESGSFVLYRNQQGRKVPYCASNPSKPASHADPKTWASFDLTLAAFQSYPGFDGINAVCSPEFTFVDLDDCVSDGNVSEEARAIMRSLPVTYWELSPSRTGLHGIFHSNGGIYLSKHPGSIVEAYSEKHFMSCTGDRVSDAPIGRVEGEYLKRFRPKNKTASTAPLTAGDCPATIPQGLRTKALVSLAGKMHYAGCDRGSIATALRDLGAKCDPPVDEKKIQGILRSAAKWPATENNLLVRERQDVGNADRLLLYGCGDYRYIAAFNRWAVYDGVRWPIEDSEHQTIRAEAHAMVRAFAMQAVRADNKECIKFAAESLNSARISNLLREAQPHATLTIQELDRDPLLVNFRNGTLDARTGELRDHRREDYITAIIPHDYDAKAKCPKWERFVNVTFGSDKDLISFVQRALGYSLTADTSAKCIFLAYGPTDTGKTTLLATVNRLLGDYAGRIKVESLMVERGKALDNNAQADLADLRCKRFVMTSETGQGQLLREALIKLLSQGQGNYKAVRKYENPFEFPETWKIWMDCNHLPRVRDTDESIWNRLRVIPFDHAVTSKRKNLQLGEELLAEEAEGILAWMARGLRGWMDQGLRPPDSMNKQRDEWRAESDTLKQWMDAECVLGADVKAQSTQLYDSYKQWRSTHGMYEVTMTLFARNMKEHGFEKKLCGDKKVPNWLGVGIKAR